MAVAGHLQDVCVPLVVADGVGALGIRAHEMHSVPLAFAQSLGLSVDQILGRQTFVPHRAWLLLVLFGVVFDFALDGQTLLDLPLHVRWHRAGARALHRGWLGHLAVSLLMFLKPSAAPKP